jgi:hypothetical protein
MDRIYFDYTQEELDNQEAEQQNYTVVQMPKFNRMVKTYNKWASRQLWSAIAVLVSLVGIGTGVAIKSLSTILVFVAVFVLSGISMLFCGSEIYKGLGEL